MTLLHIEGLSKSFGDRRILHDVSFSLRQGEFLSILGKSGSGKTTLLRLIAGFEKPDKGTIKLSGVTLSSQTAFIPTEKRNIGIVFQDHALWPHMTIFENVAFPLKIRKYPPKEIQKNVEESLNLVNMKDLAKAYPHQLSGGEAQRVALARSLVQKPKVIIFDEPLASLDALLRHELQGVIKELHQSYGLSCIYITHDQSEAMRLSDRMGVLENGRILQLDIPEVIYKKPSTPFVARLIGHGSILSVDVLSQDHDVAEVSFNEKIFSVRCFPSAKLKDSGVLCVRSEDIKISSEGVFQAEIEDCSYLGGSYQWELRLCTEGKERLRKTMPFSVKKGEQVSLTFQSGWLIPEA